VIWAPSENTVDEELRQWDEDVYEYWDAMYSEREEGAKIAGVHVSPTCPVESLENADLVVLEDYFVSFLVNSICDSE